MNDQDARQRFAALQKENRAKWAGLRYDIPDWRTASKMLRAWLDANKFPYALVMERDGHYYTLLCLECGEVLTWYDVKKSTTGKIELNERRPDCWGSFLPEHKLASMAIIDEIEQELDRRGYLFHHLSA